MRRRYPTRLPLLRTNDSGNDGPRQFPERLIPAVILMAAAGFALNARTLLL